VKQYNIDCLAGPGRYQDGTESTPIEVLKKAIGDEKLSQMLVSVFNDKDKKNVRSLESQIMGISGIERLKHRPQILCSEVDGSTARAFQSMKTIPSLFFIDPWGYKGLSLDLVNAVIKDWACECIFFFNYNRINMGLENDAVKRHMDALFSEKRAVELRIALEPLSPFDRESAIVEALCGALLDGGQRRYVLPFRFRDERGTRTSHHLIFITKHFRGYDIMKQVMGLASSDHEEGVPSFEYTPARQMDLFLFGFTRPLEQLRQSLMEQYAGRTMSVSELYEDHSVGTPYLMSNYKDALRKMYEKKEIQAKRRDGKPIRKGSFPDQVLVTFPERE
jgi:three-Cys-motif partner protein